jgi:hypothetical protein
LFAHSILDRKFASQSETLFVQLVKVVEEAKNLALRYRECTALGVDEAQSGIVITSTTIDTLKLCYELQDNPEADVEIKDEVNQLKYQIQNQKAKTETFSLRFKKLRGYHLSVSLLVG